MQDNNDLSHKLDIRQRALVALGRKPGLVLDLFAGEGVITRMLWRHVSCRVICVEKDRSKASKIEGARVLVADNRELLGLAEYADIIDCDAYGLVMPLIAKLPAGKLVVFTDGTPAKSRKVRSARRDFYDAVASHLRDFTIERSEGGNAFYGYGWTK